MPLSAAVSTDESWPLCRATWGIWTEVVWRGVLVIDWASGDVRVDSRGKCSGSLVGYFKRIKVCLVSLQLLLYFVDSGVNHSNFAQWSATTLGRCEEWWLCESNPR